MDNSLNNFTSLYYEVVKQQTVRRWWLVSPHLCFYQVIDKVKGGLVNPNLGRGNIQALNLLIVTTREHPLVVTRHTQPRRGNIQALNIHSSHRYLKYFGVKSFLNKVNNQNIIYKRVEH